MTAYEWATEAAGLRKHLREHPDGRYHAYLTELADLYDTNAVLARDHKPVCWPPWAHIPNAPFGLGVLERARVRTQPQPEPAAAPAMSPAVEFDAGFADREPGWDG